MSSKLKFFYNGALLTLVGLAMRGVQLFFGAYITRAVGAEGIGLNTLVMTVFSFALTFATSGVSLTVTRLTATAIGEGTPESSSRTLRGAALYSLIFSSAGTVLMFTLADVICVSLLGDARGALAMRILSLSLVPAAMSAVISGYFVGIKRVSFNAVTQTLCQLLRAGITVAMLTGLAHLGPEFAVAAMAIGITLSELICFMIALLQLVIVRRREAKAGGADIRGVCSMALPLAVSAYIRSALLTLEHSLIPKRLRDRGESNADALTSYGHLHGMALPLILFPMTPLSSFSGLLVPEFAQAQGAGDSVRISRYTGRALSATLSYAVAVGVFIFFFSEELGFAVYGSFEAGRYIAALAPVIPIMYLDHVTDAILKGIGEHIYSMWVNIADACLSVILVYILIPIMGIAGYALVIIGMEAFNFLMSYIRLRRRISFRLYIISSVVQPLGCALAATAIADRLFISAGGQTTLYLLAVKAVFAASAFVFLRVAVNFIRVKKS